ncbi:MAG: PD-(D/E)XK nuclease family protein [Actinomycetota bacterium]|nr:PD-(D/E)XK nuclease family protein [Actinomycetota bacterium]
MSRADARGRSGKSASLSRALHAVLDLVEFDRLDVADAVRRWSEQDTPHPGVERWVAHAVANVRGADAKIEDLPPGLLPVSRWWARQRPAEQGDPGVYEETVQGRRYETEDGVREIRLLRYRSVKGRPVDDREVAFAAGVVAGASPVLSNPWSKTEYLLGRFEAPDQVRIVEVGCADGSANVLFTGTRQDALDRYSVVEESLTDAVTGSGYLPGYDCARCVLVDICPVVPSMPGLLGVEGGTGPRRSWSVTTARTYDSCPARAYFYQLSLPGDRAVEDTDATRRGKAVHHWIEQRHRADPACACGASDVPNSADSWVSGDHHVEGEQARLGVQMIGDHSLVCPLRGLPADAQVLPEHLVVVFDPTANVVVVAKTDLLYQDADGWVLRETKTQHRPGHGDLFEDYPQLTLATVLSADGLFTEGEVGLRVEIERLTGAGPILTAVEVDDPAIVARARKELTSLVEGWFEDTEHPTKSGTACRDCPFTRWCPDARKVLK